MRRDPLERDSAFEEVRPSDGISKSRRSLPNVHIDGSGISWKFVRLRRGAIEKRCENGADVIVQRRVCPYLGEGGDKRVISFVPLGDYWISSAAHVMKGDFCFGAMRADRSFFLVKGVLAAMGVLPIMQ